MAEHIHARNLFHGPIVSIRDVCCRPTSSDCSGEEQSTTNDLVLPRTGLFVKHQGRQSFVADSNHVLFFNGGEPYRVSHPVPGGDDCTAFTFAEEILLDAVSRFDLAVRDRPQRPFAISHGPVEPQSSFFQHRLRQWLRSGKQSGLAVEEAAIDLLRAVLESSYRVRGQRPQKSARPSAALQRERAEAAKSYLGARFRTQVSLCQIARAVHYSPYHLARLFRREVGIPLHQYQNRLRLGAALERLTEGACDLTSLALDLGYSSHSHFTTSFRSAFGTSPSQFRRRATLEQVRQLSKNLKV